MAKPKKKPAKKTVNIRELIGNAAATLRTKGIEAAVAEVKALAAKFHSEVALADRLIVLANTLVQQSPKQALDVCEYLIKTETEPPVDAYLIAGGVQDRLGDRKASEVSMTAVIDSPRSTPAQRLKAANLLVRFGKQEVALKAAREAFDAMGRPLEHVPTILYISQVTAEFDLTDQLTNQLRQAYAEGKGAQANESPRTNLLWCEDEAINIQVVKNWSAKALPSVKTEPLPPLEPLQGRRIRVGYLSSDFREHPTSRLINGLLRNHDHSKFEIFMYCSGWDDGSPMRKEVESHCDQVHSVAKLSDQEAAALIRSHRIDVLVELNGPTRANRMGILAYRPAPVQIDYLGWPGSVGGRVVDYVVGDDITLPKALEHTYPEKIIRLSKVYQINDYAARTLPPKPTRKEAGLPEGDFLVLGMFNAINKVHNQAWAVWMKIMQAVPNTILWILDPGPLARKHLAVAAKRYGVDIKRIIGAPRLPEQLHIARLQHCDLMLDPWPYGGHTSTADALFAGVPVVALMGKNFAGRVSAALLHAAGLKGLVASDLQDYANRLVHLLKNPGELERAKAFVKEKVPTSDVFNARDKARQMEEAYEGAVRQLGGGRKKISVIIPSRKSETQETFLRRAIASIRSQTEFENFDFEIVVGLDPNVTLPNELVKDLNLTCVNASQALQAAALNAAIAKATGDYVAFLEDDDQWQPEFIKFAMQALSKADFVSSTQAEYDENGNFLRVNDFCTPSGWLMPMATLKAVGSFSIEHKFHLDNEWLGRLSNQNFRRIHLVESTAPVLDRYVNQVRPWLGRVLALSNNTVSLSRHGSAFPLVKRLVHSQSGMARISQDPKMREISRGEYEGLAKQFGRVPW